MIDRPCIPNRRRGSTIVLVIWAIAISAMICSSIQLFAMRQATSTAEAVGRVRARWAARAGIEDTIAVMADHTMNPYADDAIAMVRDMDAVYAGSFDGAEYYIVHEREDGLIRKGPMDEHSKLNVNLADRGLLMLLDDMSFDIADAITDWIDTDDEPSLLGAERDYYLSLPTPIEPRNGPIQTIAELELVAGIWPEYLRGEDWNLNNRLDPNEDDGQVSFPDDDPDEVLDGSWFALLTAATIEVGPTGSGLPRLYLPNVEPVELIERMELLGTPIDERQARSIVSFGRNPNNRLEQLLVVPLSGGTTAQGRSSGRQQDSREQDQEQEQDQDQERQQPRPSSVEELTDEQLTNLLAEATSSRPSDRAPGRMNINTVSRELFEDIMDTLEVDDNVVEEILYKRANQSEGIVSLTELRDVGSDPESYMEIMAQLFTTTSSVYTITSRGRSDSGTEVEIIAVVDRSTVPVKILEYREQ